MTDEIDVIGSSLLNRVSASNQRVRRDLRRQERIQGALRLVGTGIKIGNRVLADRAETLTNNEDFNAKKALVSKSVRDAERIITQDEEAQNYPGGEEAWLAQNKFYEPILDNFNRTFADNITEYSPTDIQNWAREKSLEEANKNIGSWRSAVQAAYRIGGEGDIQAFEDYVKVNDGVAENIGGLLFNKASSYLTGRTDTDVNAEITDAIRNNRFVDNANQLEIFNSALKAGVNVAGSKELAYTISTDSIDRVANITDYGIRTKEESPFIVQSITQVQQSYFQGGQEYEFPVLKVTGTQGGVTVERFEPITNQTTNEDGSTVLVSPYASDYNKFMGINNGTKDGIDITNNSSMFSGEGQENNQAAWLSLAAQDNPPIRIAYNEPTSVGETEEGIYGQKFKVFKYPVYSNLVGEKTPRQIGSIEQRIPMQGELNLIQMLAEITPNETVLANDTLADALSKTSVGDGQTASSLGLLNLHLIGKDGVEKLEDGEFNQEELKTLRENLNKRLTHQAYQIQLETGITAEEATDLAVSTFIGTIIQGYNSESEQINTRFQVDATTSPNSAAVIGIGYATGMDSNTEIANRIASRGTSSYIPIALGAVKEVEELISSEDPTLVIKGENIRNEILANVGSFQNMIIPLEGINDRESKDKLISSFGMISRGENPAYTFAEVLTALTGGAVPTNTATATSDTLPEKLSDVPELAGVDLVMRNRLNELVESGRMDNAFLNNMGQRINNFVSSVGSTILEDITSQPSRGSGIRTSSRDPENTAAQWESTLATLPQEQQDEYARILEELEGPK